MNYATMTLDELEQRARDTGNALALACILRADETETELKDALEALQVGHELELAGYREEAVRDTVRITDLQKGMDNYFERITKLRKALEKIINCEVNDPTSWIQKVDSLAIEAIHYDDIDGES